MYGDVNVTIGDQKAVASIAGIGAHVKIGHISRPKVCISHFL